MKPGNGNLADPRTIAWLKAWKSSGKEWPWFVKRSFKTIRGLEGLPEARKVAPPIRDDILSEEFLSEFRSGKFSVGALSIVCPHCGERCRAVLITGDEKQGFEGRCISCKRPIHELAITLRYYCGFVLPDSNIIIGGLVGADLEKSKFFEGFTAIIHPVVKQECDTKGGRAEFSRLARMAAIGRIRLLDVGPIVQRGLEIAKDEIIVDAALKYDAILVTSDNTMKERAQEKGLFCLFV